MILQIIILYVNVLTNYLSLLFQRVIIRRHNRIMILHIIRPLFIVMWVVTQLNNHVAYVKKIKEKIT